MNDDVFEPQSDKVELFDEAKVGAAARRLALSFNIAARMRSLDNDPLTQVEKLFRSTTGLNEVPAFNKDEISYLKLQLVETAAIRDRGNSFSIDELREAANALFVRAQEMNLIREEPQKPHTQWPPHPICGGLE